jgi:hypothetical protein
MPLPKEEAHTLSSLIQAISSSSSITKMATTKCFNLPWYTLRESILHHRIYNSDASPKRRSTHFIIFDSGNLFIIFNNQNGLIYPCTSFSVQHLFKTQTCIPMTATYEANQSAYPNNPSQLWRQSNPVHHIVDDPNTIPLDLATRLIHIITTKGGSDSVDHAWALLHLENALHNPANQMTHNFFHFSGNNTINHQNTHTLLTWKSTEHYRAMTFYPLLQKLHATQAPQNTSLNIHF